MPDKICPLLLASQSSSGKIHCQRNECAWWVTPQQEIKDPPGFCAIYQIAVELRSKQ